jgi:hypothetical protein
MVRSMMSQTDFPLSF